MARSHDCHQLQSVLSAHSAKRALMGALKVHNCVLLVIRADSMPHSSWNTWKQAGASQASKYKGCLLVHRSTFGPHRHG
eukprot:2458578-Amphidinium_carterae.1